MSSNTENYVPHITPTPNRLKGKVALITGGSKGIGRAIALRFAQEGGDIIIADIDADAARETENEICGYGRRCFAFHTDVSSRANVEASIDAALEKISGIDILVNNAGIIVFGSIMECELEDWRRMLDVDLTGALHCTQIIGLHMRRRKLRGRLIHIGSTASLLPTAQQGAYSVAKAGLRMLSRMAAMELGPYGITSNLLCPEGAVTDMNRELLRDASVMQQLERKIVAGRLATVEEIATCAAFLASDEAGYINGAELVHDGGVSVSSLWWR